MKGIIINTRYICGVIFVMLSFSMFLAAQEQGADDRVRVIPQLEQPAILIGEQANVRVRLIYPVGTAATLVLPEDTLVHGVEIIRTDLIDSLSINEQIKELVYNVTITSFDSATYQLNNIKAMVGGKLYTPKEAPNLMVNTLPVDLDNPEVYTDIKDQWKPKFVWQDYLIYLYIFLGAILIAVGIYYLYRYVKKKKDAPDADEIDNEVMIDPYEEALQRIINLKSQELCEKNKIKEYYTELTEIIRRYLWRVYGISTAEKTSEEILEQFRNVVGKDRMYQELVRILKTSDLVKFAKYYPSSDDNIRLLLITQEFIEEHKPVGNHPLEIEGGEA